MPGFKYVKLLDTSGFSIVQGYTAFIFFGKYDRVLNMRQDAIMERFRIFQDSEYARFLQMRRLHKFFNMREYG